MKSAHSIIRSRAGQPAIILAYILLPHAAGAIERTAILSVPASALVFSGEGLQAPDAEGHFAIGIKLPLPSITTAHCETANLIVGMGSLNKPESALTAGDRKIITRNKTYYDHLLATVKHGEMVKIHVRNDSKYLKVADGKIAAPYCTLSIDEGTDR